MSEKCDICKYDELGGLYGDGEPCDECIHNLSKCFQDYFEPKEEEDED